MGGELLAIAGAELIEALGNVIEPAADIVAGRQLTRPFIQAGALVGDPTRLDVVDQHAVAITRLREVMRHLAQRPLLVGQ